MGKDLKGKELGKGFSQRKDGRYEARIVINGNKIDIYDMNLSKLKKQFETAKLKLLQDEGTIVNNTSLKDWYAHWFEKCKSPMLKNESSKIAYDRKCKNTFIKILGDKNISNIIQINIQDATNELIECGYSTKLIKESLSAIKSCFDVAVANKMIKYNPCVSISIKEDNIKQERRVLTIKEQELFLNEVNNTYYEIPYKILLLTGMRIGEFSGLQWEDIDWDNECININRQMQTVYSKGIKKEILTTPKTNGSYRSIPFFKETKSLLIKWKSIQDNIKNNLDKRWRCKTEYGNLVFTTTMGSPITRYVLAHDLNKVEKNINLKENLLSSKEHRPPIQFKHIHPHAFRHTFATRCFEKGLDPLFVQSIMGHTNYSTTISYTHLLDEMINKELDKIEGDFL